MHPLDIDEMPLTDSQRERLERYAALVHEANQRCNLTGEKTVDDVYRRLVFDSIAPFASWRVPRGTRWADIGTGAGVPGIPLAVAYPDTRWVLIEARGKRAAFVRRAANVLRLSNVEVVEGRAEECARGELRESFDGAVSRAAAPLYIIMEIAAPLCRIGGYCAFYSRLEFSSLSAHLIEHARQLGCTPFEEGDCERYGIGEGILLFRKISGTPEQYPRRIPAIRREMRRRNLCTEERDGGPEFVS